MAEHSGSHKGHDQAVQLQQSIMFTGLLSFVRYFVDVDHCGEHTRTDTDEGHLRERKKEKGSEAE